MVASIAHSILNAYQVQKEKSSLQKDQKIEIINAIYHIVSLIPNGKVTSYGAIAAAIGLKSGARFVGYAMNHCPKDQRHLPAHRVVNRNGLLTGAGHFPPGEMQRLLEEEGFEINDNKIMNFPDFFWDPSIELNLD